MNPSGQRVTLSVLAKQAELSIAAISMALRNHPRVAKSTRTRVQLLAKKLGYRPDPALSALVAYRRDRQFHPRDSTIGIVYLSPQGSKISRHETIEEFQGISDAAQKLGYGLDTFNVTTDEGEQKKLLRVIRNRGIRGIIFQFLDCDASALRGNWEFVSVVGVGIVSRETRSPFPVVCSDHFQCAYDCTESLCGMGFSRLILLIPSSYPKSLRAEIMGGYLSATRQLSPSEHCYNLIVDMNDEGENKELERHINIDKPDGIICAGRAHGLYQWLRQQKAKPFLKLGMCTLDAISEETEISGMLQDRVGVGFVALESLHRLILSNVTGSSERYQTIYLPAKWRNGQSFPNPINNEAIKSEVIPSY